MQKTNFMQSDMNVCGPSIYKRDLPDTQSSQNRKLSTFVNNEDIHDFLDQLSPWDSVPDTQEDQQVKY